MLTVLIPEPKKLEVADLPKPQITQPDEVLVRVLAGGICGSDLHIYHGTNPLATYPRVIGHEFGGVVEEVGSAVSPERIGQRVAVDPVVACGQCYACKIGRHNVCSTLEVMGVHRDGGFAEYVVVPEKNLYTFSKEVDDTMLALVEPYSIGMQINARGQISQGDKVLIMGSGPISICALQVAVSRGAQVMVTDVLPQRLERAKASGAARVVNVKEEDLEKAVMEFTDGEGMPVIIDTVCAVCTFEQAVRLSCPAGRIVVIGLNANPSAIAQSEITKKELTIVGSRLSRARFGEVIEALEAGKLKPELLRSHTYPAADIKRAIEQIENHPEEVCKVTLTF